MKLLSVIRRIRPEISRMSSVVIVGFCVTGACEWYLIHDLGWHTIRLAVEQFLHAGHNGVSAIHLLGYFVVIVGAVGAKTVVFGTVWLFVPELWKRVEGDRLRPGYWWLYGVEYREARLAPITLGLNRNRTRRSRFRA